jgi:hypothetical protein
LKEGNKTMTKDLFLDDGIKTFDEKKISSGRARKSGSFYDTEVEFRNELGEMLFKKSNIILVGGRRFTLEKLFNITPNDNQRITLNNLFNVNESEPELTGVGPRREKVVCLFGVGRGGSNLTFGSVKNPNAREYNLYDMVPMRYVDEDSDLTQEEKNKYYLRVQEGDKIAYYLKKFELTPRIVMRVGDQEYVPDLSDNNPVDTAGELIESEDVDCYVELQLKISADDVREFFRDTEGLEQARINELSLYTAYQPEHAAGVWTDFLGIEAFSKLTFNNEPLDDATKELNIIYRIYI